MDVDIQALVDSYAVPWGIKLVLAVVIFIVGRWLAKFLTSLVEKALIRMKWDQMLIAFIISIVHSLLLLFVVIASLKQLGVDTTALVAIVGAAGLAVGLALKDSLQNFAAGVMLIVFRPFKNGDFIDAAGVMGVVEKIGIFCTTLNTPDNREVIVPNQGIYSGNITNFSANESRRIDMVFGIGYDDDIRLAKSVLEEIVRGDSRVLSDPEPTIAVSELADSSVNFVVRPWVKTDDYWDVMFDLTEKIKLTFDDKGIGIPYPQMDVHVKGQA